MNHDDMCDYLILSIHFRVLPLRALITSEASWAARLCRSQCHSPDGPTGVGPPLAPHHFSWRLRESSRWCLLVSSGVIQHRDCSEIPKHGGLTDFTQKNILHILQDGAPKIAKLPNKWLHMVDITWYNYSIHGAYFMVYKPTNRSIISGFPPIPFVHSRWINLGHFFGPTFWATHLLLEALRHILPFHGHHGMTAMQEIRPKTLTDAGSEWAS